MENVGKNGLMKSLGALLSLIMGVMIVGCSKDDKIENFLSILPAQVTYATINTCDIGDDCCLATEFDFSIIYESTSGQAITKKIMVSIEWSDGDKDSFETLDFNDSGSVVTYDWCYRFGNSEWVDVKHVLVSDNGAKSNVSEVRLEKPEGAN